MAKETLLYVAMGTSENSSQGRIELDEISEELRFRGDDKNSYEVNWRRYANSNDDELLKIDLSDFVEESIRNKRFKNFPYLIRVLSTNNQRQLAEKIISELETNYKGSMERFFSEAIFEKYFNNNNAEVILSFLKKAYKADPMNNLLLKSIDSYENEAKPKLYLSFSTSISF